MADGRYLKEETYQELMGMLRWFHQNKAKLASATKRKLAGEGAAPAITFQNAAGETIPAHAVILFDDSSYEAERAMPKAYKPDGSTDKVYLFNGPNEVEENGVGQAQTLICVRALYYPSYTPTSGDVLGPTSGEWWLKASGDVDLVRVIGPYNAGDGADTTLVGCMLSGGGSGAPADFKVGKALGTIPKSSTGTITIYDGYGWADGNKTGEILTGVYFWFTSAPNGARVALHKYGSIWIGLVTECSGDILG